MNRLFVDNLTVIDFAYLDAQRGLVGESWIVDVELEGELDDQGMVFDFGLVKRTIKRVIDETVDHCLVIPMRSPSLESWEKDPQPSVLWRLAGGGLIRHRAPAQALLCLEEAQLTKAGVASLLEETLLEILPSNVLGVHVALREEVIEGPYYHYVHGLKKHEGNCQRIAHGHRSRLRIERDGMRDTTLERAWSKTWEDIYIGTEEDVADRYVDHGMRYVAFRYQANQGEFELHLPEQRVYMVDTDTTVEWIATHLAEACKLQYPTARIRVRAFEGVGKGAIAER
ncbi:6-carboxytetrahydropterin synthase [Marinobacteraceae bacterium S3BR75-40.1]